MKRRDFLENTALGAVLAPILAIFGVEPADSSENGGNWSDFARNHPNSPEKMGSVRIVDASGHRIEVEVVHSPAAQGGVTLSDDYLPPVSPAPGEVRTERFRVGSLQEFEVEYLSRVGSKPEDVDFYRVANALGVDPV